MAKSSDQQQILILGAGVIGLTNSLVLSYTYPDAKINIVAKHFPGDRSIEYTSPWAGANWASMAHDNGPLERYDEITFKRFGELIDGKSVFGCQSSRAGESESIDGVNGGGNENGIGRMGMWGVFDAPIEETGILTEETGKVWYDQLVGGLRTLGENELPKNAVFGFEFPQTYRINTQVYLQWCVELPVPSRMASLPSWVHKRRTWAVLICRQASGSSPIQRRKTRSSPLPICLSRAKRPPFYNSSHQLHRSRFPSAIRCPRHKPLPHTRTNSPCRRTEAAHNPNVRV